MSENNIRAEVGDVWKRKTDPNYLETVVVDVILDNQDPDNPETTTVRIVPRRVAGYFLAMGKNMLLSELIHNGYFQRRDPVIKGGILEFQVHKARLLREGYISGNQ